MDLAPLADDILEDAAVDVAEAGAAKDTAAGIEGVYAGASAETRSEITRVQTEGHRIMTELRDGLPGSLQSLVADATTTTASALLIQRKAESMAPVADKNILMTDEQRAAYARDKKTLDAEVVKLNGLADRISRESGGMTDRLTRATANFQAKVGAFRGDR